MVLILEFHMKKFYLLPILAILLLIFVSCTGDDEEENEGGSSACESTFDCPVGYYCHPEKKTCTSESGDTGDTELPDTSDSGDSGDSGDSEQSDTDEPVNPDTPCDAGKLLRCDPENFENIIRCNTQGTGEESVKCGEASVCNNDKCVQQICTPGESICSEDDYSKTFKCSEKGLLSSEVVEDCKSGYCQNGSCVSLCDEAVKNHSYQGCDFYTTISTMTVDWTSNRSDPIFALTVSNTSNEFSANISIKFSSESGEVDAGQNYFCIDSENNCQSLASTTGLEIPPQKLGIIMFPNDKNVSGQGLKWNSMHIEADIPVTIFQFAPIDNSDKNPFTSSGYSANGQGQKFYSNDASLLIPTTSVYTDYVVSAHTSGSISYATIIGLSDEDTVITVRPTTAITESNGIPAIAANSEGTITLKKGHVAQIEASSDLSGSRIYCDAEKSDCHPFVVFSGVNCANIPKGYGYCDHIEQQLFPVQTWGKKYILVKSQARGEEWDLVRIYASEDGTKLTFKPATPEKIAVPSGWTSFTVSDVKTELNAGEYSEFYFKGTLEVEADKQIMVAQYLSSSQMLSKSCQSILTHGAECVGDPAMMLIPPSEQFRKDYLFLTPGSYVSNYATIVMKTGEAPVLDGSAVTDIKEIEGTDFSYAIVNLGSAFKNHTLTCSENPCGLFVYGWEIDVSYAYPGGLNFEKLSIN